MKMKRISAANVADAMNLARRELGEDAVLIDTKKTGAGVIVTFAIDPADDPVYQPPPPAPADILPFTPDIPKPATVQTEINHPALDLLRDAFAYHALAPELRERWMLEIARIPLKPGNLLNVAETALAQLLTTHIRFQPLATKATPPQRAVMLVGPHGAGKTSTIAKLATELTLAKQRVLLISTDTERLGGAESLETVAKLLKCEFALAETRAKVKTLVSAAQGKIWVLIDSAGANIYEFAQLKALGEIASLQSVEPILTCPAGMDAEEAQEMASVFQFLNIERMIVTRLDAVRRLGSVFAALTTGRYALANLTNSALPTDPCQPISAALLAQLMLRQVRERMTH